MQSSFRPEGAFKLGQHEWKQVQAREESEEQINSAICMTKKTICNMISHSYHNKSYGNSVRHQRSQARWQQLTTHNSSTLYSSQSDESDNETIACHGMCSLQQIFFCRSSSIIQTNYQGGEELCSIQLQLHLCYCKFKVSFEKMDSVSQSCPALLQIYVKPKSWEMR